MNNLYGGRQTLPRRHTPSSASRIRHRCSHRRMTESRLQPNRTRATCLWRPRYHAHPQQQHPPMNAPGGLCAACGVPLVHVMVQHHKVCGSVVVESAAPQRHHIAAVLPPPLAFRGGSGHRHHPLCNASKVAQVLRGHCPPRHVRVRKQQE